MPSQPTMREIAERAEVSRATVSMALRNDSRLRPETRQKIQALAKEMGYCQNPTVAQLMTQLRAGQQKHFQCNLAFLEFGEVELVPKQTWAGVKERAKMLGYGLELFHVRDLQPERLKQILVSRGIRGVIIRLPWGTNILPIEFRFIWDSFACCVIGAHPNSPDLNFAADDHYMTAMQAVRQLSRLGFHRIGLAMHAVINVETEYRFVGGYLSAHIENHTLKKLSVIYLEKSDRDKFLTWYRRIQPEVIICVQEEIWAWLEVAGYRIPQDVSLAHLDTEVVDAKWGGMDQGRSQTGAAAVDVVVSQINHNEMGSPVTQKANLTESTWRWGPSLAIPAKAAMR